MRWGDESLFGNRDQLRWTEWGSIGKSIDGICYEIKMGDMIKLYLDKSIDWDGIWVAKETGK